MNLTRRRPLGYALDALLGLGLFLLDLPRVWTTYPGTEVQNWEPSALALVLVALQTLPIAARRVAPVPVLAVVLIAVIGYAAMDGQPEPDYISLCVALYTVAAEVPWRVSRWWCGAAILLAPALLAEQLTFLAVWRPVLLVTLVAALGLDRQRAIADRANAAEERAKQDAREQALLVARRDLQQRERIARDLHDILSRSLTLMVLQGEAAKAAGDARHATAQLETMLDRGREALAALPAALDALDRRSPPDRPTTWSQILDDFARSGLIIDADARLPDIPLGDETGRCAYRVVHEGLTNVLRHAGLAARVRIETNVDASELAITITNDSSGDPPSYRMASSGFGLASLRRDVTSLGGVLEFGETSTGWTLAARLPRPTADTGTAPAPSHRRPIPVVLIDDQAMVREGLRLLLDSQPDITVVGEFADGSSLLTYLHANPGQPPPEASYTDALRDSGRGRLVLLLDIVMRGLDGMAVLTRLRDHPHRERLPVLVLTTFGGSTSVDRALSLGANGYVLKDGTADQLASAVRAVADGLTTLSTDNPAHPETPAAQSGEANLRGLTTREREVFRLLAKAMSNRDIARHLGLSEATVKIHVSHVMRKLGVRSRTEVALLGQHLDEPAG